MVKKKTVDGQGLPTIKYELAADGDTVVKVFCELCQNDYMQQYSCITYKGILYFIQLIFEDENIKVIPE